MSRSYLEFLPDNPAAEARPEPASVQPAGEAALVAAIGRLEVVINAESGALRLKAPIDLAEFSRAKSRCLLELTRISRSMAGVAPSPATRERLVDIRSKLETNSRLLGVHLAAVQEIAEFLSGAIGEAASDGTYSPGSLSAAGKR